MNPLIRTVWRNYIAGTFISPGVDGGFFCDKSGGNLCLFTFVRRDQAQYRPLFRRQTGGVG
jgi:hypothetical protein